MASHKINRVLFASEAKTLVGVINRPQVWPFFHFQLGELMCRLSILSFWSFELVTRASNRIEELFSLLKVSFVATNSNRM